jgi:TonB family protein
MPEYQHSNVFALLPETRPPWRKFLFSMGTEGLVVVLAAWAILSHPRAIEAVKRDYRLVTLEAPIPPSPTVPPKVTPKQPPKEAEVKLPEPEPEPEPIKVATKPKIQPPVPQTKPTPVSNLQVASKPVALPQTVAVVPRAPVRTNVFSTGSSATPTINRAPEKVQTGGFGDPNGVPANSNRTGRVAIAASGSFDLPAGPGQGNGTGGAHGASGVVASSGFGSGTATPSSGGKSGPGVQQAGFGAPETVGKGTQKAADTASAVSPAEIIFKPTPAYTEEARNMRIQGEVLLEVVFESSGSIRVLRVVRGLGHGLDESAMQAAGKIKFKPALRDGRPSDSTAVLHIVFQLA